MSGLKGVTSKGIKLSYKGSGSSFTDIDGLQEVPEIGGDKEKIDITCLSDTAKRSTTGIKDYGDLTFKFLYDNSTATSNYRILKKHENDESVVEFKLGYPDGTSHTFSAQVAVKIDSAGVNAALTFSLTLALQSDINTENPVEG